MVRPRKESTSSNALSHAAPGCRYQTEREVVVSVFIRNVKEQDLKVDLQPRAVGPERLGMHYTAR